MPKSPPSGTSQVAPPGGARAGGGHRAGGGYALLDVDATTIEAHGSPSRARGTATSGSAA